MFTSAEAYDRFMGRYSAQLSPQLAGLAGVAAGQRVLDVGCGPGALTGELVARQATVSAIDPSSEFVAAVRERYADVEAHVGPAESLPFADDEFDAALAQLVVHFMSDPVGGLREMARVTRPGGVVVASVWDHAGGRTPLGPFWDAVGDAGHDESDLPGAREGHLGELFREAGLADVEETELPVEVLHATFDDWWEPFTLGVGPAGAYLAALGPEERAELTGRCRAAFPAAGLRMTARAWAARGTAAA